MVSELYQRARDAWSSLSRSTLDKEVFLTGFLTLTAQRSTGESVTLMTNRMSSRRVRFVTPNTLVPGETLELQLPVSRGNRVQARARVGEVGPTAHGQLGVLELGVGRETRELLTSYLLERKAG